MTSVDLSPARISGVSDGSQPVMVTSYYPVSPVKFGALSILTFGFYPLFWFYKNWKYIRARDESDISPFWRAVFSELWCYWLIQDVREHGDVESRRSLSQGGLIAIAYFLLLAAVRLPDPYWLISALDFVVLLPVVTAINNLNVDERAYDQNSRVRWYHLGLLLIAGPLLLVTAGPMLNLTPHIEVVTADRVPEGHVDWMRAQGMLDDEETIIYFYSAGVFSFRADGNVVTDASVISYWKEDGETYFDRADYDEIADLLVEYGEDSLTNTAIQVTKHDGTEFVLFASAEKGLDRTFITAIRTRIPQ